MEKRLVTPQTGTSWANEGPLGTTRLIPSKSQEYRIVVAFPTASRLSEQDPHDPPSNVHLVCDTVPTRSSSLVRQRKQPAHPLAPRFSGRRDTLYGSSSCVGGVPLAGIATGTSRLNAPKLPAKTSNLPPPVTILCRIPGQGHDDHHNVIVAKGGSEPQSIPSPAHALIHGEGLGLIV
ncbi:unnamed protein product [Sordaria macrospora k-hell]|uniref:WGS project CABT00000000 data, contig 2.3 n=1 Tax=Sordaria macrospora (strain ATCC MYA-333 / DSM 997 / K(L3346) / K-hell) TaxID=771870 RepID=F7VPB4_SORMK|nr:uncharacterized protein SMAC_02349 [Sordaria macrospora k-hell]CCC07342.1 unnamed protein product [Sordaria macrospora k-hell]